MGVVGHTRSSDGKSSPSRSQPIVAAGERKRWVLQGLNPSYALRAELDSCKNTAQSARRERARNSQPIKAVVGVIAIDASTNFKGCWIFATTPH